jgi:hypothetical protein
MKKKVLNFVLTKFRIIALITLFILIIKFLMEKPILCKVTQMKNFKVLSLLGAVLDNYFK